MDSDCHYSVSLTPSSSSSSTRHKPANMSKPNTLVCYLVACLTFLNLLTESSAYKHVVWVHGIFAGAEEFSDFRKFILKVHPGTTFSVIDMYDYIESLTALNLQVKAIRPHLVKIMKEHPEGLHLLCYSQGGLVCRSLIESTPNHNIDTFIALSTPQGGQYGDTSYLKRYIPVTAKRDMYKFFYTKYGQKLSIANYWNDPHQQKLYLKYATFLAGLNNQSYNAHSHEYKANFLRLKNVVLIGGPDDGVISPWQSSQFGAFNADEKVVLMKDQPWYQKDSFGLQTLDKRSSLHMYTIPGIIHIKWHRNHTVFDCCVQKWLT